MYSRLGRSEETGLGSSRLTCPVEADVDSLHRREAFPDGPVDVGEEGLDLLFRVDDLDHDGEITGKAQNLGRVESAVSTKPFKATEDCRAGQSMFSRLEDDHASQLGRGAA